DSDDDGSGDGGGISRYDGQIWIAHTLIANNVDRGGEYPDCFNRNNSSLFASQGYNLAEVPCFTSAAGDITGQDPRLGPLQDNGGPAMAEGWALLTHALGAGSPARDVGNLTFAPPPAYDQRGSGFPRAVGRVDIGAFEAWAATALPLILRQ
ncbi:MAG: hypothetical protein GX601_09310, partial [Anaerolineales bacterium]|nr:hypothetical protein [Anaerolineales bacterium]